MKNTPAVLKPARCLTIAQLEGRISSFSTVLLQQIWNYKLDFNEPFMVDFDYVLFDAMSVTNSLKHFEGIHEVIKILFFELHVYQNAKPLSFTSRLKFRGFYIRIKMDNLFMDIYFPDDQMSWKKLIAFKVKLSNSEILIPKLDKFLKVNQENHTLFLSYKSTHGKYIPKT